ncbi:MAG TPA: sigma-54 dependent transcriptional regulator [Polyangiaceae bacterium]|jgi:DNA-binding NtrC family response regulator|nr:sigma-54 dependent transcriptional regulator [Polyangiaceae bacterium]
MTEPTRNLLLVDADAARTAKLREALAAGRIAVHAVKDTAAAITALESASFDAILLGQNPAQSAAHVVTEFVTRCPDIPVLPFVSDGDGEDARAAMDAGASDYLSSSFDPAEVSFVVNKAIAAAQPVAEAPPVKRGGREQMALVSAPMREVFETVRRAAQGVATVLVRGESGAGKEVVARRVHMLSPRRDRPFIKVHCAALPEQILESELFGYEKGAFTGAVTRKPGRVELAEGGTLFLDEIGDISLAMQVKLLRVLQDKQFERLGGTRTLDADVRFVAATHRNLEKMIKKGEFREDLYYRLNVVRVDVPPLRERADDVEPLVLQFVTNFATENAKQVRLSLEALELLKKARWPGNVRQLQNFVERLVVLTDSAVIGGAEVQAELERQAGAFSASDTQSEVSLVELDAVVRRAERKAIQKALQKSRGDRTLAARILGISRRTLFYKLSDMSLDD